MPNLHIRAGRVRGATLIEGLRKMSGLSPLVMRKMLAQTQLGQNPRGDFSKEDISKIIAKIQRKSNFAIQKDAMKNLETFLNREHRLEARKAPPSAAAAPPTPAKAPISEAEDLPIG